jgi:hypothetical protein
MPSLSSILIVATLPVLALSYQSAAPWRVALNVGREGGFSTMPLAWGQSGGRLPLVVPCDFCDDGTITPRSDVVRFTDINGEVVKPVQGGTWSVENNRNLDFSLKFPEAVQRNDITIDADTQISLKGFVYTTNDLNALNQKFYDARSVEWKAMDQVDNLVRRREAPKKWDQSSNQWVKAYAPESLSDILGKQWTVFTKEMERKKEDQNRPRPKDLSMGAGPLPGMDSDVYMGMSGDITIKKGWRDVKIGTWAAEPINDGPRSYYAN